MGGKSVGIGIGKVLLDTLPFIIGYLGIYPIMEN